MGNKKSRTVEIDNIQSYLSQCQEIEKINCRVYGPLHHVRYSKMEFYLGEAHSQNPPPMTALHYLVPPNLLVIPQFTFLEDVKPQSIDQLLEIMLGVAELCRDSQVGIGHNRIGYAGKWGIVGEKGVAWAYQQVFREPETIGVYLSPQLMLGLSQQKLYPKHNPIKSDIFAFGVMLLEIIFETKLTEVFDYNQFEIKLKPLLQKLNSVKQNFGEGLYNIFLRMLELEEQDRIDFQDLIEMVTALRKPSKILSSNMTTSNNSIQDQRNISPMRKKHSVLYRNDCSPFKGGFIQKTRTPQRIGKTPERSRLIQRQNNRSPLKRDLRINTRFDKQNNFSNLGYASNRSPYKPTLIRNNISPLSRR